MAGRNPLALPLAFTGALAGLALLAPVRANPRLLLSFVGAALALGAWNAALAARTRRRARTLSLEIVRGSSTTCRRAPRARCCSTGAGTGRRSTSRPTSSPRSCCSRMPSTCCSPGRGATSTPSASAPFPSSSASTCFSGSSRTGSTCSLRSWRSGSPPRS